MSRLEEFRKTMPKEVDAVLLFDETNQYYFTSYKFTDGIVMITRDEAYLVTDFRYYEEATAAVTDFEVVTPPFHWEFVADIFKSKKIKCVGLEDSTISFSLRKKVVDSVCASVIDISSYIDAMRQIKTKQEIEHIQRSQQIADMTFDHVVKMLTLGMTEIDVALEIEFFMRKNGAEAIAFDTIAVSGTASALPHGKPRNVKLERGFLTMDFGAVYMGYCSDMTRTVSIGKATKDMHDVYNTVLNAQKIGIANIISGAECSKVDSFARNYINDNGYKGMFGHSLGHGVGMLVHERPNLSPKAKDIFLKSGNVVTVEPGVYISGEYGCRIEDMVVVTEEGCENLTKSTKELIEIY